MPQEVLENYLCLGLHHKSVHVSLANSAAEVYNDVVFMLYLQTLMLRLIRSVLPIWILVFTALSASATEIQPVKYVFLFIGDGMSFPQRQMAEAYVQKTENRRLKINAMPYQAITATHSANAYITDSAAAGTAIACGVKTNNGTLGLTPDGEQLESIAELAHKNGRKVGIITSVTINHATPAAFYAHNASRSSDYAIGLDLIASGFDYFGGGGVAKNFHRIGNLLPA